MTVARLPSEQQTALDTARHLAACGVPLFICKPATDETGEWVPAGGTSGTGYVFPVGWQRSVADVGVVDRWRQGDALCAVMGHTVDGADFDLAHGGDRSEEHLKSVGALPAVYGTASTPSGGWHHLVAALGVRSRDGVLPGFDYKAGVDGGGHGFLFIAPTVKLSKVTGDPSAYSWTTAPDLDGLALLGADLTGGGLRALLAERVGVEYAGPTYIGRRYGELTDAERSWSDSEVAGLAEWWTSVFAEASGWGDDVRDERGRGWEALVRDWTWVCARLAVTPWVSLDVDSARELCASVVPPGVASAVGSKWNQSLMARASAKAVAPPPWDGLGVLRNQERVDVSNEAKAAEWLRNEIGMVGTPLAGLFRRGEEVVHTPRIDEDGYVALGRGTGDLDGPAQIRVAGGSRVGARVQFSYSVVKRARGKGDRVEGALFPRSSVEMVLGDTQMAPNLRVLRGVTHTPMLRRDGSVLDAVGYDDESRRLYLPPEGLVVADVPTRPSASDVAEARGLVLGMLADFPWNSLHDRANYLALLLTPLMRELVAPPYKMGVLNAHQPGSGKSLLAWILRELHGGVLRGDAPSDGDEFRKQITSVLMTTTAPIVQFDNVRHMEASVLDALLTSDTWSDRVLGATREVTVRNDRLWVCTGNNVSLGGDLVRRVLWVSIDPRVPHPEARTDFAVADLKGWVREQRGQLLRALLVWLRAWVVAGRPTGARVGSDDFAGWIEACRGVLSVVGIDGTVEEGGTVVQKTTLEGDDMSAFFQEISGKMGAQSAWLASKLADEVWNYAPEGLHVDNVRSLGKWLSAHEGRWAGDLCIRGAGFGPDGRARLWKVEKYGMG